MWLFLLLNLKTKTMETIFAYFFLENKEKNLINKLVNVIIGFVIALLVGGLSLVYIQPLFRGPILPPQIEVYLKPFTNWEKFLQSCVLAPFLEELAFRWAPSRIARALGERQTLAPIVVLSSFIFGYMHGDVSNVWFQGLLGFIFFAVYVKNDYSYKSAVLLHAMWNFFVVFGIEIFSK